MNNQVQLEKAIRLSVKSHTGQYDRGGKPYILHPLHLMNQLMFDVELATIAVLHDSIEDSSLTIGDLVDAGFSARVIEAVGLLTHIEGEDYMDGYISDICTNYDAIRVKRKDLEHNSDITRLKGIKDKDIVRMKKYHEAFIMLGKARQNFEEAK